MRASARSLSGNRTVTANRRSPSQTWLTVRLAKATADHERTMREFAEAIGWDLGAAHRTLALLRVRQQVVSGWEDGNGRALRWYEAKEG